MKTAVTIPFRFPTSAEWDKLCNICRDSDDIIHWIDMATWCEDIVIAGQSASRANRGFTSARDWNNYSASYRDVNVGFRPVFGILGPDALGLEDGTIVTAGTLYMNGEPVKIPREPIAGGDMKDYEPDAILEFKEALSDPDHQVKAIKVGSIFIADRCLLKNISWDDIADNM